MASLFQRRRSKATQTERVRERRHEGFLRYANFRWAKISGGACLVAILGYALIDVQPRRAVFEGPSGQMTLDLRTFGVAGAPAGVVKAATEAAAAAEAAAAGPPMPPPTPDEAKRIEEIRKRIEARRAQLQSHNPPPPPVPHASNAASNTTSTTASSRPGLQEVKE